MDENSTIQSSRRPLYGRIVEYIMEQIRTGAFSFDTPICTEADLMQRFGVSRITVRHALSQLESQGILTRKRGVGSFVNPDIYQNQEPQPSPQAARTGPGHVVAFVVPFNIARTGLMATYQEATNYLNALGYFTSVYISAENGDNRGRFILQRLTQMDISGIAYYPYTDDIHLDTLNELMFSGKPVVLMDLPSRYPYFASVTSDNLGGERELVRHLTALGHRRIAFLSGIPITARETLGDRYSGYILGLSDAGIRPDASLVITDMTPARRALPPQNPQSMASAITDLREKGVTAIVCEHDEIAYYVLQSCRELGLRVPEDISVCGFDDDEWAAMISDKHITTIAQDWSAIGRTVAQLLYEGMEAPLAHHALVVVPTRFVEGTTTGPVPRHKA